MQYPHSDFDRIQPGDEVSSTWYAKHKGVVVGILTNSAAGRRVTKISVAFPEAGTIDYEATSWAEDKCVVVGNRLKSYDKPYAPSNIADAVQPLENNEEKTEGLRFNGGKPRFDLIEPAALEELSKVFTAGAEKYEVHNWLLGMDWSKMDASLQRHLNAWRSGEDTDPESGSPHMAHVAWNAMALVSYATHGLGRDDRICNFINKDT